LDDGALLIPPECSICKSKIIPNTFERQLNDAQYILYLSYATMKELSAEEKMQSCSFCKYFEIQSNGMDFFFCKEEKCLKSSCVHCFKECKPPVNGGYLRKDLDNVKDEASFLYHMECAELSIFKKEFEKALSDGLGVACPACGVAGVKNDYG
jgi:hypothetical protein